jgi:hypothetical protein
VAQALDRIQNLFLVRQKSIAEFLRPVELLAHHREHLGKSHQRFDARVPILLLERGGDRVALEAGVLFYPTVGQRDFERIGRRHQDLRNQRIRVQRDWR